MMDYYMSIFLEIQQDLLSQTQDCSCVYALTRSVTHGLKHCTQVGHMVFYIKSAEPFRELAFLFAVLSTAKPKWVLSHIYSLLTPHEIRWVLCW